MGEEEGVYICLQSARRIVCQSDSRRDRVLGPHQALGYLFKMGLYVPRRLSHIALEISYLTHSMSTTSGSFGSPSS
jgi:hypothetical protein